MLVSLMLFCHLKLETLKLWTLRFKFPLFVLATSELDISNVEFSILLSPQIWNIKILK